MDVTVNLGRRNRVRSKLMLGMLSAAIGATLLGGCGGKDDAQEATQTGQPAPAQPAQPPADGAAPAEGVAGGAPAVAEEERTYEIRKRLIDATSAQDEWVPELTATPVESVAETIKRADDAFKAGRIDQGEPNALTLYLSVLETEPENADAIAGVDKVATALVERGEKALVAGRFNEAARMVQVVTRLRPDDEGLATLKAKVDAGREVALLLGEAQRLAAAGRAVEPAGENAAALYREILRTDPENAAAQAGLVKLEADLIAQATGAAEAGNYAESDRLLADAGKVRPGSDTVQNASTRIVEMRQGRAGNLAEQASAAIDAGELDRAEQLLGQLDQVSAQQQGIDELRARIENARNYASLKPGQAITDKLSNGSNAPEVVVVPIGNFTMGSPDGEADRKSNEGPRHRVNIRGFALGRTEITVGQFRAFVNATRYRPTSEQGGGSSIYDEKTGSMADKSGVTWEDDHAGKRADSNLPVIHVSWNDAKAYTDWLTRETGKAYRLPSEAEFEYVLRAGSDTRFPWGDGNPSRVVGNLTGDGDRSASRRNWVNAFPGYNDNYWGPAPVRSFEPNRFGLYDLAGNVSEWVEDCWHDNYQRAPADGSAWVNPGCTRRVIRGASWASAPDQVRSGFRLTASPSTVNPRLGFRVARDL